MSDMCFAEYGNGCCTALNDPLCCGHDKCPFYKTVEENEAELLKYNGARNVETVIRRYSLQHEGRGKSPYKVSVAPNLPPEVTEENRKIFALYAEGIQPSKIAKEVGLPSSTVSSRIARAKKRGFIRVRQNF